MKVRNHAAEAKYATSCKEDLAMKRQISSNTYERGIGVPALLFAAVLVLALSATPVLGQATAALNGTVRDSAGPVVIDAAVVLHQRHTHLGRSAKANSVGTYVMPEEPPGDYHFNVPK